MITTAQVMTFLLFHLGVILVVSAYYALAAVLMPGVTGRAAARFARRPWLAGLIGILLSIPWAVVAIALIQAQGPAGGVGAVIGLAWIFCGLLGGAGIAQHVGGMGGLAGATLRIATHDAERRATQAAPIAAGLRGGVLITLTWALPLIGWFFVLPLTLATGLGCLILGLLPSKGSRATEATVSAAPEGPAAPSSDQSIAFT